MSFLYRHLLILIACVALLFGIQIPNFVDQYQKRLDAHFQEVQTNLKGYREIADREFGGSIEELIRKHKESDDLVFRDEAAPIETIYLRYLHFNEQHTALQTPLPQQVLYLLQHVDRELLRETYDSYSYSVPLNSAAVYSGFVVAAAVLLVVELLAGVIGLVIGLGSRPAKPLRY